MKGCLRFKEIQDITEFSKEKGDSFFEIVNDVPKCKSNIGMNANASRPSRLTLGSPKCWKDDGFTVLHEIVHVLGMMGGGVKG